MAGANTTINIAELDFDLIKASFKDYLRNQDAFSDYNFEGSVISTVLDILAYNTHYNAYYLNMVANEMFLDTATKRSSVVSHSKLLNYTPRSYVAPRALVNITFTGCTDPTLTIPKYTKFYSQAVDGVNYPYVTLTETTVNVSGGVATFTGLELYQGQPIKYSYTVNALTNPKFVFKLPDATVDTSTLVVSVFPNAVSTTYSVFEPIRNYLTLDPNTNVYFLQEALDGSYEVYFGDGILGAKLYDGNVVVIEYLITKGSASNGISSFTLMDDIGTYTSSTITVTENSIGGQEKETISSIKYSANKAYASQNRAVTKSDYVSLLQNNNSIIPIEAVNVWGGEELEHPEYGKMFICIKPQSGYSITQSQKYRLLNEVIKPISIITTIPVIVDPDYTYLKFNITALFNKNISVYDAAQLKGIIKTKVIEYGNEHLNTFNSMFVLPDFIVAIKGADPAIITLEIDTILQKKFTPIFNTSNSFQLEFGYGIERGSLSSNYFDYIVPETAQIIPNCKLEETPESLNHVESFQIITPGSGYTSIPTVEIFGDGSGATAVVEVTNGAVTGITVTKAGSRYTQAIAVISGGGGSGATCTVVLSGNAVPIRSYYYNNGIKVILQDNIGTVNYTTGVVSITNYQPYRVDDALGRTLIDVKPTTTLLESTRDKILTLDTLDNSAIDVSVVVK